MKLTKAQVNMLNKIKDGYSPVVKERSAQVLLDLGLVERNSLGKYKVLNDFDRIQKFLNQ